MYGEPDGTETGAPPFTEVSGPLLPSVSRPLSPKLYLGFRLPYGSMYFWALSADGLFFSEWGKNSIFFQVLQVILVMSWIWNTWHY